MPEPVIKVIVSQDATTVRAEPFQDLGFNPGEIVHWLFFEADTDRALDAKAFSLQFRNSPGPFSKTTVAGNEIITTVAEDRHGRFKCFVKKIATNEDLEWDLAGVDPQGVNVDVPPPPPH